MSIIQDLHEARQARLERLGAIPDERRGALAQAVAERDELIKSQSVIIARQNGLIKDFEVRLMALESIKALNGDYKDESACEPAPARVPSVERILRTVCKYYNIARVDVCSERRTADVTRPRQIVMYLCATVSGRSLPMIGRLLGNRDHTTALHGRDKIKKLRLVDSGLNSELVELERILAAAP